MAMRVKAYRSLSTVEVKRSCPFRSTIRGAFRVERGTELGKKMY